MSAVPSHLTATTCAAPTRVCRRRRPGRTALYRLVQQYLETWLAHRREHDADGVPIPRHVERELRGNFLIAYSRKGRGLCPSWSSTCFPQVPVRQWVVIFPRRLRCFLHRDPVLLGRVRRSVLRAIESGLRRRCPDAPPGSRFGAGSFVQRFGSASTSGFNGCRRRR